MKNSKEYYKNIIKEKKDYKVLTMNFLQSFIFGGLLCLISNIIYNLIKLKLEHEDATLLTIMIVILCVGILTAIGIYDKLGQIAKCGLAIPISGFANTCISSAMEYKKEGLILGIGSNCLKLAGSVLVLGTFFSFIVALLRYIGYMIL